MGHRANSVQTPGGKAILTLMRKRNSWGELPIGPFSNIRVQLYRQQILSRLQGGAAFLLSIPRLAFRFAIAFESRSVCRTLRDPVPGPKVFPVER